MTTFVYTFDPDTPVGTDPASQIDDYIKKDTKRSIAERYALEHIALDDTATGADDDDTNISQGRHKPGLCSVCYLGTTAEINSDLSSAKAGAIAYDTTLGVLKRHDGTDWTTDVLSRPVPTVYTANAAVSSQAINQTTADGISNKIAVTGSSIAFTTTSPNSTVWGFWTIIGDMSGDTRAWESSNRVRHMLSIDGSYQGVPQRSFCISDFPHFAHGSAYNANIAAGSHTATIQAYWEQVGSGNTLGGLVIERVDFRLIVFE